MQLAQAGHRVYLTARNEQALETLVAMYPQQLVALAADVTDDSSMQQLFARMPDVLRPTSLDGIILCAGICEYVNLPELDMASFRRVMAVNYFGAVNACAAAMPLLMVAAADPDRGKPEITGVCSMTVMTGFPRAEAYGAAKAAMAYFLESLRCDVQEQIDVCVVYPGFVATAMTRGNDFPMPFCIDAATAAQHILKILGKGRRSFSFPWQLFWLLRLVRCFQGLWFKMLIPKLSRQSAPNAATDRGRHS